MTRPIFLLFLITAATGCLDSGSQSPDEQAPSTPGRFSNIREWEASLDTLPEQYDGLLVNLVAKARGDFAIYMDFFGTSADGIQGGGEYRDACTVLATDGNLRPRLYGAPRAGPDGHVLGNDLDGRTSITPLQSGADTTFLVDVLSGDSLLVFMAIEDRHGWLERGAEISFRIEGTAAFDVVETTPVEMQCLGDLSEGQQGSFVRFQGTTVVRERTVPLQNHGAGFLYYVIGSDVDYRISSTNSAGPNETHEKSTPAGQYDREAHYIPRPDGAELGLIIESLEAANTHEFFVLNVFGLTSEAMNALLGDDPAIV